MFSEIFILSLLAISSIRSTPVEESSTVPTQQSTSAAIGTAVPLCPCGKNETITPSTSLPNHLIHGMTCLCQAGPIKASVQRDDYTYSPGIGAHKLHTRAATWNEARKLCNEEGGHLAIVNSLTEARVLMDIFNKSGPVKGASYQDLAYVGIHDFYKEGEWTTVLGESLYKTGYTRWSDKWGGQPDNGGSSGNQNCGTFLKEGGLDDVNCEVPFAFFCELPMTYVIH